MVVVVVERERERERERQKKIGNQAHCLKKWTWNMALRGAFLLQTGVVVIIGCFCN